MKLTLRGGHLWRRGVHLWFGSHQVTAVMDTQWAQGWIHLLGPAGASCFLIMLIKQSPSTEVNSSWWMRATSGVSAVWGDLQPRKRIKSKGAMWSSTLVPKPQVSAPELPPRCSWHVPGPAGAGLAGWRVMVPTGQGPDVEDEVSRPQGDAREEQAVWRHDCPHTPELLLVWARQAWLGAFTSTVSPLGSPGYLWIWAKADISAHHPPPQSLLQDKHF